MNLRRSEVVTSEIGTWRKTLTKYLVLPYEHYGAIVEAYLKQLGIIDSEQDLISCSLPEWNDEDDEDNTELLIEFELRETN
jgi:hypothetical protein